MASVAAATSSSRRRRREYEIKLRAQKQAKAARERKELKSRASMVLEDLTNGSETVDLDQSELEGFLRETLKTRHLDEHAVQMVADAATKQSELEIFLRESLEARQLDEHDVQVVADATTKNTSRPSLLSKQALVNSVSFYKEYTSQTKMVEEIFKNYNRAGDGKITKGELLRLLQDKERKANRAANGVAITLVVSPKDVKYVIEQADANGDGCISRAELLPALAAWDRLAHLKMEQKQMAACCVIL